MKIKPSAMFFEKQDFTFISQYDAKASMYRVCYSTHSSLSEIRDMINHLKPKQVFPNVIDKLTEKEVSKQMFQFTLFNFSAMSFIICKTSDTLRLFRERTKFCMHFLLSTVLFIIKMKMNFSDNGIKFLI